MRSSWIIRLDFYDFISYLKTCSFSIIQIHKMIRKMSVKQVTGYITNLNISMLYKFCTYVTYSKNDSANSSKPWIRLLISCPFVLIVLRTCLITANKQLTRPADKFCLLCPVWEAFGSRVLLQRELVLQIKNSKSSEKLSLSSLRKSQESFCSVWDIR